jgi:hypothetical protein
MRMKHYESFDKYMRDQNAKNKAVIRALRKFVNSREPHLREAVKWGNGCWVSDTEPVAYVYSAPGFVQFGFFRGSFLKDPRRLLEGNRRYVRHIKVRIPSDIDARSFGDLLRQAARRAADRHVAPSD